LDRIDDRQGLDKSYDIPSGGEGAHVYVLDTGIRTTHEDFTGRAIPAYDVFGGAKRVCNGDATCAMDRQGHGTHCAGTVGGARSGVAKKTTLYAVKVLSDSGRGSTAGIVQAIDWTIKNHKKPAVMSMSLGGGRSTALNAAVKKAQQAKVDVVVAAGNSRTDACRFSPASEPLVITVGATSQNDARASFSNYGRCVDIFAPGQGILSATSTSNNAYRSLSGTSMACPHVAGAAALLLAKEKSMGRDLTNFNVTKALLETATNGKVTDARQGSPNKLLYVDPDYLNEPPTTTTTTMKMTTTMTTTKKTGTARRRRRRANSRRRRGTTGRRRRRRRGRTTRRRRNSRRRRTTPKA